MTRSPALLIALAAALLSSCASTSDTKKETPTLAQSKRISDVRTTAYTHSESDHIVHGVKSATGSDLKFGKVRSAAADWSVYPVGTVFQIEGTPWVYQIDDYGSALVGTNTIDLYKPTKSEMNQWGVRKVNIKVLKWGSFAESLNIMKPRSKYSHVRKMVQRIETSS
ncbi:MAG: 3D domain-containing protein [Verrucomicrobiales bacterium]|nr:3D domain-containing protein [Verrucomicrobiales bacterium]